ncbi:MAG: hypothetical protein ACMVY4_15810 [Minwuia sp.]|uniref:hypothetical protein n=1 Tax=Minwuia sp. TaxID=2493630 RepID=UPI003A8B353D
MAETAGKVARVLAVAVVAFPVLLGGCQTTGDSDGGGSLFDFGGSSSDDPNLTPEERALREDAEVFNETVFGGAATGAVIAGGLCALGALLGNNGGNALGRCAIMAGVGGAIGAIDGYMVAKRQEAARKQVREIDLVTEEIEAKNVKLRRLVDSSRRVVDQNRQRLEEVRIKVAANAAREDELRREKDRLEANIDVMDDTLENLRDERDNYEEVVRELRAGGQNTAQLEAQIGEMNQQIAALERERNELEAINRAVRIG